MNLEGPKEAKCKLYISRHLKTPCLTVHLVLNHIFISGPQIMPRKETDLDLLSFPLEVP